MQNLLTTVWTGLELLYAFVFIAAFLPLRKKKKQLIIPFILTWVFMYLYVNSNISELVKPLLTIAVFTAVSLYSFASTWFIHVFLAALSYIFIAIFDTAVPYGLCTIMGISFQQLVWMKLTYITVVTVGKLLQILFAWILQRIRSRKALSGIHFRWIILTLLFPTVSVVMLIVTFLSSQQNEDLTMGAVIYSGILAVANIAILYIIHSIEESIRREQDMVLLKQQMTLQKENYAALEKNYGNQRKATHEFERHLQTLRDLLDRNEYQTAQSYIRQLQNNRVLRIFSVNSGHPVVDVILNQKYQDAKANSIHMHIKVNDLSKVSIETDALVVLLANLLDNAIEACQRLDGRREIYCSLCMDDMLYISIRNTSPPIEIINGEIKTSKSGHVEHGYGIPAIRLILDQLGAEYTFDYNEGWFQFAAEVIIKH